jgi:hypothetical protein
MKLVSVFAALAVTMAMAVALAGCGGSDSSAAETSAGKRPLYPWLKGPSRQFLIRGGDNAVQVFGREATAAEREQVSRIIHRWLQARAAQNWAKDCSYFPPSYAKSLTEDAHRVSGGKVKTCPQALAYFGHTASGTYKNNLDGPIVSLRVGDGHGYAQYHGNDGHDWVIAVSREKGRWFVATPTPLGRSR